MTMLLACASHSPLMDDGPCLPAERDVVEAGFQALARVIRSFEPDLIIQFSPDHFNGFGYATMPMFCVGAAATSVGDFDTLPGELEVPGQAALALTEWLIDQGFDPAISHQMRVDHGFVQVWEKLFGSTAGLPILPVFVNCAAPPLPTAKRARQLGDAVGRFALASGRKVLIVASGGLSHDPPIPRIADPALPDRARQRLLWGHEDSDAARATHRDRIHALGARAFAGDADILPVSQTWDRAFLDSLRNGLPDALDGLKMSDVVRDAGRGGPEVLCWIAAVAALRQGGPIETKLHAYEALQGWIAGMAILSGRNIDTSSEVRDA